MVKQGLQMALLLGFDPGGTAKKWAYVCAKTDRTEPIRPKSDYPWFWCEEEPGTDPTGGKDFVGNRWNDVHLTLSRKKEASS